MSLSGFITAPVRLALFDPRVTAPLLVAILYYPQKLREILPTRLHPLLSSPTAIQALKVFLALSVVRKLNNKLSQLVANNWKSDAKFIKSQELVLVTGGSSGIGQLMARDFSRFGVKVVILDVNPPKEPLPRNVFFYEADVTSSSQIASTAAEIRKDHGDPTVLINNAGIATGRTILSGTDETVRKTFEVNTISHFLMAREFLPAMIAKNHGHIVTIASMASFIVHAQNVDYACSKASALAFHEGLHSELKTRYKAPNIRTTVVNPTWIRTPLIEPLTSRSDFKDPVLEPDFVSNAIVQQVLAGRGGQLILPSNHNFLTTLRAWPTWMQTSLRNNIASQLEIAFVP